MALVTLPELLEHARAHGYAVGYFEAWDQDSLEVIAGVAERLRAPAILGFGGLSVNEDWLDRGGIRRAGLLTRDVAETTSVPSVALLNEVASLEQAETGLDAGFNAAMLHTQAESFEGAAHLVASLVTLAHGRGAAVEGEVGEMPEEHDGERLGTAENRTSPSEALRFVELTNVDCLAVAVGNAHFVVRSERPQLDIQSIREISREVKVPLVLHGGSGLPAEQVTEAVAAGIAKINVGTRLKQRYAMAFSRLVNDIDETCNFNELVGSRKQGDLARRALESVGAEVERLTRAFGAAGRA